MKNYKLAIVLSVYLLMSFSAPAFAVNEICTTNASCCKPPQAVIAGDDLGLGCRAGTYWIGPEVGGGCKTVTTTCAAPSNFNCATGTCTTVSTPGTGCPGWQLNLGGGNCVDVLKIIKNSVDPKILNIYNGGLLGSVVYANTSGTVGINTTTPSSSYKLDVNGATNTTSLNSGLVTTGSLAITGVKNCIFPENSLKTDANGVVSCQQVYDNDWYKQLISPYNMWNINEGNVGIGTTAPAAKLDIVGLANSSPALKVQSNTTGTSDQIVFRANSANTGDFFNIYGESNTNRTLYVQGISHFNGKVSISSAVPPKSTLSVGGGVAIGNYAGWYTAPNNGLIVEENVGIGTQSPTSKLHVVGNTSSPALTIDSNYGGGDQITINGASGGSSDVFNIYGNGTGRALYVGGKSSFTDTIMVGGYGINIGTLTTSNPPYNGLIVGGNVGIGTANPKDKLLVAPNGDGSGLGIGWNRSAGTGETDFYNYGQWGVGGFTFWNYQSPGGSYPSSNPTKLLTLSNNSSFAMGSLADASGDSSMAMGPSTTASGNYSVAFGWNSQATNDYSVAMGYSSKANGYASVAMGDGTTASGTGSVAIGKNCINSYSNSIAVCNANTDALIASGTDNSWLAARGGNVGIGTQSPGYKLDVTDRIRLRGASSSSTAGLWLADSNAIDRAFIGLETDNWPPKVGIYNNGDWRISIDYGGNVGIGTTSPAGKLDVNGSTYLRGNTAVTGNFSSTGSISGGSISGSSISASSITTGYIHSTGSGLFSSGLTAYGDTVLGGNTGVSGTLNAWGDINAPYNNTLSDCVDSPILNYGNTFWGCPNGKFVQGFNIWNNDSNGAQFTVRCCGL